MALGWILYRIISTHLLLLQFFKVDVFQRWRRRRRRRDGGGESGDGWTASSRRPLSARLLILARIDRTGSPLVTQTTRPTHRLQHHQQQQQWHQFLFFKIILLFCGIMLKWYWEWKTRIWHTPQYGNQNEAKFHFINSFKTRRWIHTKQTLTKQR